MTLKHSYNSTVAEDPASGTPGGLVGPNEWNADHAVSGTSLQTLFNNAGSLTGMSGTSWDNTNLALTITGATVTTSNPILNLSQTWNAGGVTFTGLKFNVTNTASAAASKLADIQVGGNSAFTFNLSGEIDAYTTPGVSPTGLRINDGGNNRISFYSSGARTGFIGFTTTAVNINSNDYVGPILLTPGNQTVVIAAGATAEALQVYNTTDNNVAPTNYERGVFDWTTNSNVLTIGTQNGGTGTGRDVYIQTGSVRTWFGNTGHSPAGLFWSSGIGGFINTNSGAFGWATDSTFSFGSNPTAVDTALSRTTAGVVEINNGNAGTLTSTFLHWGGQQRVTADVPVTSSTVLTNATGLAVALIAGRTYSFEVQLSFTDAAAGGIQAAMVASGGLTATNIIYDGWIVDSAANGIKGNAQATSLGGVVASATTTGTAGHVTIYGIITVNVAGTINVQFAQNTSNGTATTVKRGSYLIVHDMP